MKAHTFTVRNDVIVIIYHCDKLLKTRNEGSNEVRQRKEISKIPKTLTCAADYFASWIALW